MAITIKPTFLFYPYVHTGPCIYAIVNRDNGKIYIGSAINFCGRARVHRSDLKGQKHHSHYLQRAFNRSPNSFYFEIVEEMEKPAREQIVAREQFWMDFYRSWDKKSGYNLSPTAHSCLGYKHTMQTRQNMAKSRIGLRRNDETKAKMSVSIRAAKAAKPPMTPGQKIAWSLARMGHACSEEEKLRKRQWAKNNVNGRHRAVIQLSKTGEYIGGFKSASEAGRSLGCTSGNISSLCAGGSERKVALGFIWKYAF